MTEGTVANAQSFMTDSAKVALDISIKASSPVVVRAGLTYLTVTGVSVGQDEAGNVAIVVNAQ